jgi:hypothetical protein
MYIQENTFEEGMPAIISRSISQKKNSFPIVGNLSVANERELCKCVEFR